MKEIFIISESVHGGYKNILLTYLEFTIAKFYFFYMKNILNKNYLINN